MAQPVAIVAANGDSGPFGAPSCGHGVQIHRLWRRGGELLLAELAKVQDLCTESLNLVSGPRRIYYDSG